MAFNDGITYAGPLVGLNLGTPNQGNSMYLQFSTAALRPAAGNKGVYHFATDTKLASYDNGAAWQNIGHVVAFTTKGDIVVFNGTAPVILAAGPNDQVITADSAQASGLKYAAAGLVAATQVEMEAATSNTVAATPGRTKNHPGVAKAWAKFTPPDTTIDDSYNIASITDDAVGIFTYNFTSAFSNAHYAAVHGWRFGVNAKEILGETAGVPAIRSTTQLKIYDTETSTGSNGNADPEVVSSVFYGDQ